MPTSDAATLPAGRAEMRSMLRDMQDDVIGLVSPAFLALGLILLVVARHFPIPSQPGLAGLLLVVVAAAVWLLHRGNYLATAWTMVGGSLLANLVVASGDGIGAAICLLALPAGLATLFVSVTGGLGIAAACTLLLVLAPPAVLPAGGALRLVAALGLWGTVGLVWLTLRPLLTAWQWSWSSYQQSRRLLEEARDYQVQLKQALADLADANLQLTRLNHLAQNLREAADEARRAKEQFVANVSHELRTPLNMIIGFSEMIVAAPATYGAHLPPALLADLAVILRNSQHLSSLIDDVLDLSQIEAGQMALTRERVPLAEIVEAAMVAVRPLFDSGGLSLRAEVPGDLVAFCDRTRIREVMLNLLSNAGRFTERGGVHIRAWREGADAVVSVADTGPGIAVEAKDKLFQPFQQLDGTVRRRYGGTGLGLAISKNFVELHGGRMWLESQVNVGTTFYFRLPAERPAGNESVPSRWINAQWEYDGRARRPVVPHPVVRPRFVVLESGASLGRLLTRYLNGAEVVPVSSLHEATEELARVPALALLVNDATVDEALRRVLETVELPYGTPAIVCSVPGVLEAADALGVAGYLVKPVGRDRLLGALEELDLKGKTVLVVDDEPEELRLFRRMLASSERSYRVLRAANGRQALDVLARQRPDAILVDLVMPEMDGFQFLAAKGADDGLRDIPTVVISGRDPAGQPIFANALAVTRGGGLSMPQLLACIEALSSILGTMREAGR